MKPQRAIKLKGNKILLCPIEKKDIRLFHKWISDLTVTKTTRASCQIFTIDDEKNWFQNLRKKKSNLTLAIIAKASGKTIGNISLNKIDQTHRRARLGIMIGDKNYWGKGYGREAITLLLDFAFNVLNIHSISLTVHSYNKRAIRSYKAVGFKQAGKRRQAHFWGGKYYDNILMDILASEFKKSKLKDLILEPQKR